MPGGDEAESGVEFAAVGLGEGAVGTEAAARGEINSLLLRLDE
jgi:hypothetical protein